MKTIGIYLVNQPNDHYKMSQKVYNQPNGHYGIPLESLLTTCKKIEKNFIY